MVRGKTSLLSTSTSAPVDDHNSRRPRVVIVEDEVAHATLIKRALEENSTLPNKISFSVALASGPKEARAFIDSDTADIYLVDLKLGDPEIVGRISKVIGINLVREISARTTAGVIVHSSEPEETDGPPLLVTGADDYIEKPASPEKIRSRVLALWRRIQMVRPSHSAEFEHSSRTFLVGEWRFKVGKRELTDSSNNMVRLSPTEHAFLRYLCMNPKHEIDRRTFNVSVLERPTYEQEMRIDSLVDKIRAKLNRKVEIISVGESAYRLISVREIKSNLLDPGA